METGVARRPIADFDAYREELERFVYRSGQLMRPVFEAAKNAAEAHRLRRGRGRARAARRADLASTSGIAEPILLGRRAVIEQRVRDMGLRMDLDKAVRVLDPTQDRGRVRPAVRRLPAPRRAPRRRRPMPRARRVGTRRSIAAAMLLQAGAGGCGDLRRQRQLVAAASSMCCRSFRAAPRATRVYALSCLILQSGVLFVCDTHMLVDPTAEQIAEMTLLAAEAVRAFGITPKAALAVAFQLRRERQRFGAARCARR